MVKGFTNVFGKGLATLRKEKRDVCIPVLSGCQGIEAVSYCAQQNHFVFNAEVCHNVQYWTQSSRGMNNKRGTEQKCLFTRLNFDGDTKTMLLLKL